MKQVTSTMPLIEAKSEGLPAGGVPPKGVSQSRSMACACRAGAGHGRDNKKPAKPVSLRV